MNYQFIEQVPEDYAEQLHALYQSEWWSKGRTLEQTRTVLKFSDFTFGFADADARLVAFTRILTDRVFKAWIFDVIVHPEHRGAGLGKLLMERVIGHPVVGQVEHIELYCLPDRFAFYRRLGFTDEMGELRLFRRKRG